MDYAADIRASARAEMETQGRVELEKALRVFPVEQRLSEAQAAIDRLAKKEARDAKLRARAGCGSCDVRDRLRQSWALPYSCPRT